MKKLTCLWVLGFLILGNAYTQNVASPLRSGPMVGYAEMREVLIWVQTHEPAKVQVKYAAQSTPDQLHATDIYATQKSTAYTAHLICDEVQPGQTYTYQVFVNGKQLDLAYETQFQTPELWKYRTDPPDYTIAMGSCTYVNDTLYDRPGKPYGDGYEIFTSLHQEKPDLMLWLGDNTYLREADWYSRTGILHRFSHTRALSELQPFLANTSHYAIWDDHDFGPNNSDFTYSRKDQTLDAFRLFWGNPTYGSGNMGGIVSSFEWGDAQFFLLDNRYFRCANKSTQSPRSILGEEQLTWLLDALVSSTARFKFVCIGGQVLNSAALYENYSAIAPEERQIILDHITQAEIKNVIFLTGDRHHAELSRYEKHGIVVYDFTSSPLTSGSHDATAEPNTLRVEGSHVGIRNYGIIAVTGKPDDRRVRLELKDSQGVSLWVHEITAQ